MRNAIRFLSKWCLIFLVTSALIFLAVRMMPTTPVDKWLDAYHLPHTAENEAYVKENTTELVDPLGAEKRMAELKEKKEKLLSELETQIKVSNATTVIEF